MSSGEVSFDQGYLGFVLDFRASSSTFTSANFVSFESIVGTSGDDSFSGFVSNAVVYGGDGDDRLSVRGNDTIVIGGQGSDDLIANGMIYVGGDWDGSFGRQAGDNTTDYFFGDSVILDFELPDGTFAGDKLVVAGSMNSSNPDALDTFLSQQFVDSVWVDPNGVEHAAAIYPLVDGTGAFFTLVGVTAADANNLVLPNISVQIGTGEAGFVLSGTANDDWFELYDNGNNVLFEQDGGNDTLLYGDSANPSDDTLYFEGGLPTGWTLSNTDGVNVWTADYNGQTITIVGLDQAGFDSLTMVAVPVGTTPESLAASASLVSAMTVSNDTEIMSSLLSDSSDPQSGSLGGANEPPDVGLLPQIVDELSSSGEVDSLLDGLLDSGGFGQGTAVAASTVPVAAEGLLQLLDGQVSSFGAIDAASFGIDDVDASVLAGSAG